MGNDTIAAVSTGMTASGIGIVRMSGPKVFEIIDRIYKGKKLLSKERTHTIHYGFIKDGDETLDQVLVTVMRAPRTFTGEDTVEINCHGGVYVINRVLETVIKNGARPAQPGEFTKRAFLNGKVDLSQAEAVLDIINSKNEYALQSSISQLKGREKKEINDIRNIIIYNTAHIEAALDDPEHINIDGYNVMLKAELEGIIKRVEKLIASAGKGRIMKEGILTVIVGKPNAGKSSLLNVLAGKERAIVTDIAGTTRDALEEQIRLQGLTLNIIDTAGIRKTDNVIEKIGVEKAKEYVNRADLILYVVDAAVPLDENDKEIIKLLEGRKTIILLNKSDLKAVITKDMLLKELEAALPGLKGCIDSIPMIDISAKEEQGINKFEAVLKDMFLKGEISFNDEIYITNLRHKAALCDASKSLKNVIKSIDDALPEDFFTIDLMDAYSSLGSITGQTVGEDLINEIFSKFCMGK